MIPTIGFYGMAETVKHRQKKHVEETAKVVGAILETTPPGPVAFETPPPDFRYELMA